MPGLIVDIWISETELDAGQPLSQNWQELPEAQLLVRIESEVQELLGPVRVGMAQALLSTAAFTSCGARNASESVRLN